MIDLKSSHLDCIISEKAGILYSFKVSHLGCFGIVTSCQNVTYFKPATRLLGIKNGFWNTEQNVKDISG